MRYIKTKKIEYYCMTCKMDFEVEYSMISDKSIACPKCKKSHYVIRTDHPLAKNRD